VSERFVASSWRSEFVPVSLPRKEGKWLQGPILWQHKIFGLLDLALALALALAIKQRFKVQGFPMVKSKQIKQVNNRQIQ
jgi:hypothetical protein